MKTVEIYKKSEVAASEKEEKELNRIQQEIETLKNWREFYENSGLQGQAKLFEQKAKNLRRKKLLIEKGVPYPRVTKEQLEVFDSVFNCCVPAEEFSARSMPPEVVEAYLEAKEYKEVGVFKSIGVAYYDGDPILIAEAAREPKGDGKHYLLARWGDGLKPWEWFVKYHLNEKRAHIPSPRWPITLVIASTLFLVFYLLLPMHNILKPIVLTLGVACSAVSASFLIDKFKAEKAYSRALNEPIPSPFKTAAQ